MDKTSSLKDWLHFNDRERHNPISAASITTHALMEQRTGELHEIGARHQEWLIRSALVDASNVHSVRHPVDPNDLEASPSWIGEMKFDFVDQISID